MRLFSRIYAQSLNPLSVLSCNFLSDCELPLLTFNVLVEKRRPHLQVKDGLSINKKRPLVRLFSAVHLEFFFFCSSRFQTALRIQINEI